MIDPHVSPVIAQHFSRLETENVNLQNVSKTSKSPFDLPVINEKFGYPNHTLRGYDFGLASVLAWAPF